MNCPNCNSNLEEGVSICPNCGILINKVTNQANGRNSFFRILKNNIIKYKKIELSIFVILIIISVSIFLYSFIVGFETLSWKKKYNAYSLDYVTQTYVKLGVKISNSDKEKDIKISTTCGTVSNDDLELTWDLTESLGECEISASYKLKKITKKLTVISSSINETDLSLIYDIDLNSDEDLDLDGLTNKEETNLGTNPLLEDTDMDGLTDYYELNTSKTDPLKNDTDDDGLTDYDEIELGTDPLLTYTFKDGIKDGDRTFEYLYNENEIKMQITGKGNVASTTATVINGSKLSNKVGMIDNLYNFSSSGEIEKAVITIKYTDEDVSKYGLNEENLSIYYYNDTDNKYEKIDTIVDTENKTLTATLTHFSLYVVGDASLVKETSSTEILFVLDNSWSMYTNKQYEEITGEEYSSNSIFGTGSLEGTDAEGLRFSLTSDLVTKFSEKKYRLGLSEFRQDYANAIKVGTDYDKIKKKLDDMFGNFITNNPGTYIGNALINGVSEFSSDADNKFIIILTDGEDTSYSSFETKVINQANENNVKICAIGFSSGSNSSTLSSISSGTGCKYFSSSDVSGLKELFENLETEVNNDLVDIDEDGETDGLLMADSGFIVNRDGFSFQNYGTNLSSGHCFGMATFAELYYLKQLPLSLDGITVGEDTSYGYDLKNTYFKNYANLFDYNLRTELLKYTFGYEAFNLDMPEDIRKLDGTKLVFGKTYNDELNGTDLFDIVEVNSSLSKEKQIEKWGVSYKSVDTALLNEDNMQTSSDIDNNDLQMFNAIYTYFIKQNQDVFYSSGTNFTLWLRNVVGSEVDEYPGATGFINILKSRLENGDPAVIISPFSGGLHAINAISLIQNINNPNYYYIGVYDNNYPGEKRYVDVECKKNSCYTVANEYYSSSKEPIRITASLEKDLQYVK